MQYSHDAWRSRHYLYIFSGMESLTGAMLFLSFMIVSRPLLPWQSHNFPRWVSASSPNFEGVHGSGVEHVVINDAISLKDLSWDICSGLLTFWSQVLSDIRVSLTLSLLSLSPSAICFRYSFLSLWAPKKVLALTKTISFAGSSKTIGWSLLVLFHLFKSVNLCTSLFECFKLYIRSGYF